MKLILIFLVQFIIQCGSSSSNSSGSRVANGLLYTGTSLEFGSTGLYQIDSEKNLNSSVLPNQSGDFIIKKSKGRVFVFNRKDAENLNLREISMENGVYAVGTQTGLDESLVGDPWDIYLLDDNLLLILGYNSHAIHVIDIASGEITQTLESNWDIPGAGPLFPVKIIEPENGNNEIYFLHQGNAIDYSSTFPGVLFKLNWNDSDSTLSAVDLDENTANVQGVELIGHLPSNAFSNSNGTIDIVSLCYFGQATCVNGIDRVDISSMTASSVPFSDLSNIFSYGRTRWTENGSLFTQAQRELSGNLTTELLYLDIENDSTRSIYEYSDKNEDQFDDTGLLEYDIASETLFAGSPTSNFEGKITTFINFEEQETFTTPEVPQNGIKVSVSGFTP